MNIKAFLSREVEAIKRDREYKASHSGVVGHTLQEAMEHFEQYPSIVTRLNRVYGSVYRAKTKVLGLHVDAYNFYHRGRYGWASPDTWSMDYTLAKHLDGYFREFIRVSSGIVDYEEDNTDKIALQIADAFKAYHEHVDRDWNLDFKGDNIKEQMDEMYREQEEVHNNLKAALVAMGEHYPAFWW